MRVPAAVVLAVFAAVGGKAQSDPGFTGTWKLNPARSEIGALPSAPDPLIRVEQSPVNLTITERENGALTKFAFPLNGTEQKRRIGDSTASTSAKWEGSTLLVNTVISGSQNYTVMEKWRRSRDGETLTITRTVVRLSGETESTLVYEVDRPFIDDSIRPVELAKIEPKSSAPSETPLRVFGQRPSSDATPTKPAAPVYEYVVGSGTRILLRLTNAVNTKHTATGDKVYLETAAPVFVDGKLVIPRGSYVIGVVTESERAGRVKGKAALNLRFESLTLPNGTTRDFRSRAGSVDTAGNVDRSEGKISGDNNKGGDARTIGKTTAAGTGIGAAAGAASGHLGMGAGIGAAAGAAAGLAGILGTRGPDVVLPPGTTMEMVLDRELRFTDRELR